MDKLLTYIITSIFIIAIIKFVFNYASNYFKYKKFIQKHFSQDKIYTINELSAAFNLDIETMKKILRMLEKAFVFRKMNALGVTMDKDYFSKYEIKILVRMLVKKTNGTLDR